MRKTYKRSIGRMNSFFLFAIAMTIILSAIIFLYTNTVSLIHHEITILNENNAIQFAASTTSVLEQVERLAASLCIDEDVQSFFNFENPTSWDSSFHKRLNAKLRTYTFGSNYIFSISLYSPRYQRVLCDRDLTPNVLTDASLKDGVDVGWLDHMKELRDDRIRTDVAIRAAGGRYPYVLTIIKQYQSFSGKGAVAIDIDLAKLYDLICPAPLLNTEVYVLDSLGQIIMEKNKRQLFSDAMTNEKTRLFSADQKRLSSFCKEGTQPMAYAQEYEEKYGLYYVSVTTTEASYEYRLNQVRKTAIGVGVLCTMVTVMLSILFSVYSVRPFRDILQLLSSPQTAKNATKYSAREVKEIADRIVDTLQVNEELRTELDKRMELFSQTQIRALQSQINPHFLFKTLNIIAVLIQEEAGEDAMAAKVAEDLADVLRYSLQSENVVSLEEEIICTRKYVSILMQRYYQRFEAVFDIPDDLMHMQVPRLVLQPMIENAVFHGIAVRSEETGGILQISARSITHRFKGEEIPCIRICITDNGGGMAEEQIREILSSLHSTEGLPKKHIGLNNVVKRMMLIFDDNCEVSVQSKLGEGSQISLVFPMLRCNEH